jgi:hypothetical protein
MCAATQEPAVTIQSTDIVEASGIAASRRDDDILWVHNDSGDTARFFAVSRETDSEGRQLAALSLPDANAIDWEDMAIGPGPKDGVDYLYLADIGDNDAVRANVIVYRAVEPVVSVAGTPTPSGDNNYTGGALVSSEAVTLRYPDHPHDAETLMVDPDGGDLFIVTKELSGAPSTVFRAPASTTPGSATTLEQVGQIDFKSLPMAATPGPDAPTLVRALPFLPTGGDISPDGSLIAIRTYGSVWVWPRAEGTSVADALAGQPCEAPSAVEQQGEAIAFDSDGRGYVTTSEGASPPLHHFVAGP